MKQSTIIYISIGLLILLSMAAIAWKQVLQPFLVSWEGFSSKPYWDHKQWSWGYGTKVPGSTNDPGINPGGTITRTQAMQALINYVTNDYNYLSPFIKRPLNANQWAAYLSFSYNLGKGNADNLVANINSGDNAALETQWKKYIYASGQVNDQLVARRNAEWQLWIS